MFLHIVSTSFEITIFIFYYAKRHLDGYYKSENVRLGTLRLAFGQQVDMAISQNLHTSLGL